MTGTLPLKDIRVVEMSHMIMGPSCGMILAQLGAEVIKVEPPKGDKTRDLGGMGTAFFPLFNRGKRSVVLDLETEAGRQALAALLARADVFIENFRDGQLAKQGIDADALRRRHPGLIVAGHKGFLSGPYAHRPALDEVVQMMSGLAMMTGSLEAPRRVGSSANDIMGGMFGVIGILGALLARTRTGKGQDIRIGLFENCLFMVAQHMVQYDLTGAPSVPMPQRVHAWPIYDIFTTRDGGRIFIGVVTEGHWRVFCATFDLPGMLNDARLGNATDRIAARDWTVPLVAERIAGHDLSDLTETLDRLNIPFSPINRPEDMFDDPHVLRDGGLVASTNADGQVFRAPTLPLELDGQSLGKGLNVPVLGADTDAVLAELGLSGGGRR
jgi:crotonobetainyl-CoA:carnitine CoA-transferase CaiB-like acyl-CoA transferase